MTTLKSVYPLYLNNEAQQPNTDLEVTDKFTGEVAFRTALNPGCCHHRCGDRGRGRAAEPMARARRASRRQNVLTHCVTRFKERFDELAYALCVEAGKPIKPIQEGEVTPLDRYLPHRGRGIGAD
jgi:acyl-CoA reductase-like NAD-dependent aldehyde dehydrogenase